jgi:hypothetical protein
MLKTLLAMTLLLPIMAMADVPACIEKEITHTVVCGGSQESAGHFLQIGGDLTERVYVQNPDTLPDRVCPKLGAQTTYFMVMRDLLTDQYFAFMSKFGSSAAGEVGDKPDMTRFMDGQTLNLKIYGLYDGSVAGREDVIIKRTGDKTAEAKVSLDLATPGADQTFPIDTTLSCKID